MQIMQYYIDFRMNVFLKFFEYKVPPPIEAVECGQKRQLFDYGLNKNTK